MADISSNDSNATSTISVACYTGAITKAPSEAVISWTIEDIKDKMAKFKPGTSLRTSIFNIKGTKWVCELWPNGWNMSLKDNISVSVKAQFPGKPFTAKIEFSVGKSDHGWFKSRELTEEFNKDTPGAGCVGWGIEKFLCHEFVLQNEKHLINRGRTEFMIKVSLVQEGKTNPQPNLQEESSEINRLRKLADNFSDLLDDENSSDFQIICEDVTFPVHRNVLKSRSSFFKGLFNNFVENQSGRIVLEDMDSETVRILIEYIYTGRLKNVEAKAIELLKASNKYDFPLLKTACEDELMSTMNLENVVDLFILAEDHNASELREAAKKMILENKADIVKQDGWGVKLGTLVLELFQAI